MDMKHKNISTLSSSLLSIFIEQGKTFFTLEEADSLFPLAKTEVTVKQLVSRMVKQGLLMRIKDGLYYIIPYEQNAEDFMPDWHLLAEPLAGGDHYIGYYSALQIHNLITQPSLKEQIVVNRQIKPSKLNIKGVEFQFIYHNADHFFGAKKTWIDSFNKVQCSDLEKTIIDCLFKPNYAGGIVEVAKAIYMAKDKIKYPQLLNYTVRFNSQAVIKRLGYLLELLEIDTVIIPELQKIRTKAIVPLDTELPKEGVISTRWSVQQNIDSQTIKTSITT